MNNKFEQAALQSLETSGQFTPQQREAIARAIEMAFRQMSLVIYEQPHSHPELEKRLQALRDEQESRKSSG